MKNNPNYRETEEGWEYVGGKQKGLNPFKDLGKRKAQWYSNGIPLKDDGTIDIEQWEKELEQKKGRK